MPRWPRHVPLLDAIVRLRRGPPDRGAIALLAAMAAVAATLVAAPWSRPIQRALMRAHHLCPASILEWTALQVVPKMYAFRHRVWFSDEPLSDDLLARGTAPPFAVEEIAINHYPGRVTRFETVRSEIHARERDLHLFVRSSYRDASMSSAFVVSREDGVLVVRRRDLR